MIINIAQTYSRYPIGRYPEDSPHNGQDFRDNILIPALKTLKEDEELIVVLDGTRTLGSSFLEEAFGGLVRYLKKNQTYIVENIIKKLKFVSSKETTTNEIQQYITDALDND